MEYFVLHERILNTRNMNFCIFYKKMIFNVQKVSSKKFLRRFSPTTSKFIIPKTQKTLVKSTGPISSTKYPKICSKKCKKSQLQIVRMHFPRLQHLLQPLTLDEEVKNSNNRSNKRLPHNCTPVLVHTHQHTHYIRT